MASRVTPGVLERSHHIQTLKKLGFSKPPTSTSSSARTRRDRTRPARIARAKPRSAPTKVDPWPVEASAPPPRLLAELGLRLMRRAVTTPGPRWMIQSLGCPRAPESPDTCHPD